MLRSELDKSYRLTVGLTASAQIYRLTVALTAGAQAYRLTAALIASPCFTAKLVVCQDVACCQGVAQLLVNFTKSTASGMERTNVAFAQFTWRSPL